MNYKEIMELTKAGFTKQDIIMLAGREQPRQQQLQYQMTPQMPYQMTPQMPYQMPQAQNADTAALQSQISELKTMIQMNNIMNTGNNQQPESTDDILSKIINPDIPPIGMEPNGGRIVNG